jgi:tetratricopeptide (TPR) repeat protein
MLLPMHVEAQHLWEQPLIYMLPVYCKYTQDFRERIPGGNNRAEIDRWTGVMGPTFNHMHHYCYGLMDMNRAALLSREDRTFNLNNSLAEFDYVIERAPPDFSMLPEIITRKGESLIQLDRAGEGIFEFQRAVKIDPHYVPPYSAASDFYKSTGQLPKAREWLEKGLSAAPNAKALTRRLEELDKVKGKRKTSPGSARKPAATMPD